MQTRLAAPLLFAALALLAPVAKASGETLLELERTRARLAGEAAGATAPNGAGSGTRASGRGAIAPPALALLRSAKPAVPLALVPALVPGRSPAALAGAAFAPGDVLVIGKDDDFATAPPFDYEGPLAVSAGAAGASDWLAFRFATQELAHELPIEVTGLTLGLDNLRGRTAWPLVGLALEDAARPFQPAPPVAQVAPFADPASSPLLPPPAGSVADAFARLPVTFAAPVTLPLSLSVDDGMWSDAFNRAADEVLDHTGSDWAECDFSSCVASVSNPIPALLDVLSGRVVKRLAGDRIAAKFPAGAAFAARPYAEDRDLSIQVAYDVTDPAADRAGLFFRYQGPTQFYLAQYRKSSNSIGLWAFVSGGPPVLLRDSGNLASTPRAGTLQVTVTGSKPTTHITVRLNGAPLFTVDDATHAYVGLLAGIASLTVASDLPSSREVWDGYTVARNPDVFALVHLPPGGSAALPAERSPAAADYRNVLESTDGVTYALLGAEDGCLRPPGAFVSMAVRDGTSETPPVDNVFRVETRLATLDVACPGCATTLNLCSAGSGPRDLTAPVLETGQPFDLSVSWWNDHVADVSRLMFEFVLWDGECGTGAPLLDRLVVPLADTGQQSAGGPAHRRLGVPGASYLPVAAGTYCAQVYELYDLNSDTCPDGYEANCTTCSCTGDPDQNPATAFLTRELTVFDPCTPAATSELVHNSLRMTRAAVLLDTRLAVSTTAPSGRFYNLHTTMTRSAVADPGFRTQVPPWRARLFGRVPVEFTETLPDPDPGRVVYAALFQTDGCPSNWSLADP